MRAETEFEQIADGYDRYLSGDNTFNVLGANRITDRFDLRNCVPLFGRMAKHWRLSGLDVRRLDQIVAPTANTIRPTDHPATEFNLLKVSYNGRCEVESRKPGNRIRASSMHQVSAGQIVFSTIRASDGAVGIVPPELDGALVSETSYTVFDCTSPQDAAYLWSVLRSHELRADMQSLSPGSGRYTTYWPDVGQLLIPWYPNDRREQIGNDLIQVWVRERQLAEQQRQSWPMSRN